MTTTTAQATKAQQMLDAIAAGQTLFSHGPTGWCIVGPTADIVSGATITVTKKSGQTSTVIVDLVGASFEKKGIAYTVASFHDAPQVHLTTIPTSHSHHQHHSSYSSHKTDHEDCLSLGCCGPHCEYHDTIHPGYQH